MNLYITADKLGEQSGGGAVTYHEAEALKALGPCRIVDREVLGKEWAVTISAEDEEDLKRQLQDPWCWDHWARSAVGTSLSNFAHFYAGTFSRAIEGLKSRGCKISYTAAAHDIEESRKEHELLGVPFNYPHLVQPKLRDRYVKGYLEADLLICPSTHSARVMRGFGAKQPIFIIPHGCYLPEKVAPLPKKFTVGYLGAVGPDKGLIYLLQAWKKLNYGGDALLQIAGPHSQSDFVFGLITQIIGRNDNIALRGWVENVSDFYNSISLYVQPSVTEGFGIEVLEAMAHSRPVICSVGAGAHDVVPLSQRLEQFKTSPRDVIDLANSINYMKDQQGWLCELGWANREEAEKYTWDKIRERYIQVWKELLK